MNLSSKITLSFPYPPVEFNENNITKCPHQKHLGIVLDSKLSFNTHIDQKIKKCNKLIGLMRWLLVSLPRCALRGKNWYNTRNFKRKTL